MECRPSARTAVDDPGRCAYSYGSEGWGFESLRARHRNPRPTRCSKRLPRSGILVLWPGVSQFLTVLSDLVNPGERSLAPLQIFLARVDVSLLRERRVIMTRPLADDRDRHARVLHERQGCMAGVMQGDPRQPGSPKQAAELVGVPLGVYGFGRLRGDGQEWSLADHGRTSRRIGGGPAS
jgi:hypothetical protein